MALLHLPSSPSPWQRTFDGDYSKYNNGQVTSVPLKHLQKSTRIEDKADCKDARFDVETIAACIHGYGEPLFSKRACLTETLTMGGPVSAVIFQGFGKIHEKLANPPVLPANPHGVNANSPIVLNPNPNLLGDKPSGFKAYFHLIFDGGDDSGKGSGSGGQGGGSSGHNFGPGGYFDRHNSGLAILGMLTIFHGVDEGKLLDHKAAFGSLKSLLSTLISMPAFADRHAKRSVIKEALSEFANVFELEIDGLDQNSRTGVDNQDVVYIRGECNKGSHAITADNDYAMHGQNMTALLAHNLCASPSLPNDGFDEIDSEKARYSSCICSTCSSQTNSFHSDVAVKTYNYYQRFYTFLANVCRHVSHFGWKFSEENYNVSVNVPTKIDVINGDMPCSAQDDEIQVKAWDLEGAMDSMVLLAEGGQNMELLSVKRSEMTLDAGVSSQKQRFLWKYGINEKFSSSQHVQMTAHHEQQGVMGWLGQLARPALAKHVDNHGNISKIEQATQHESRVSSTEGVPSSPKVDSKHVDNHGNISKIEQATQHESRVSSTEGVPSSPKVDSQASETPTGAKQSDVDALKRLQRETFSELMKLREKLEKLEQLAQARQKLDKVGAARTHFNGQVKAGTAFVLLEDSSSRHARDSLEQAGMQTGLDVKFIFETPFREKDVLITHCHSGQGSSVGDGRALGGPLSVGKLHYVAHVNDDVSFSFVPLGAQGKDVTEIINVLQDQGLTAFSSQGPALFNHCKGSALGATVSGSRFAFSLAQYLSGWGNHVSTTGSLLEEDPLCLSTLGQFLLQPTEGFILSLSGLNRYWPCPPLPSSMALHWSEMGPLVIPKIQSLKENRLRKSQVGSNGESLLHMHRTGSHWENPDLEYGVSAFESKGAGLLSLAVASSLDLGENLSISSWAQIEKGEMLQDANIGNIQWALSVAKTSGSGIDWGASIGNSRPDIWSMPTNNHDDFSRYDRDHFHGRQLHMEAFLKLSCGRGFTLQPGLLYVSNQHSHTPAFVIRSSWSL